jgi:hypothetical protein
MGRNIVYPLEIKKDQGKHDLIGQINKYRLHFQFLFHYKFFEKVEPVTICSCYDNYALQELKQNKVRTLIYTISGDKFNLKAI